MKASMEKTLDCFGLLANGSSGAWSISIDKSIKGKERWFAETGTRMSLPSSGTYTWMIESLLTRGIPYTDGAAINLR